MEPYHLKKHHACNTSNWNILGIFIVCFIQASSLAYALGVTRLSQRNHVVQNLRAYFILHVITIKVAICVLEKIELFRMPERPRPSLQDILEDLSLARKIKQQ